MKKRFFTIILVTALFGAVQTTVAQNFEFRGVKANARYDDGETTHNEYLGWDEEKAKQSVWEDGIWFDGIWTNGDWRMGQDENRRQRTDSPDKWSEKNFHGKM